MSYNNCFSVKARVRYYITMTLTTYVMLGAWEQPLLFLLTFTRCIREKHFRHLVYHSESTYRCRTSIHIATGGFESGPIFLSCTLFQSINYESCCTLNTSHFCHDRVHFQTCRCRQQTWLCWRRFRFLKSQDTCPKSFRSWFLDGWCLQFRSSVLWLSWLVRLTSYSTMSGSPGKVRWAHSAKANNQYWLLLSEYITNKSCK